MDALKREIGQKIGGDSAEAPLTFTLIYSAKRDGFDVDIFHELCDGKGPTMTVLHGKGVLFGGYTSQSWVSHEKTSKIIDEHAFLFCREEHNSAPTIIFEANDDQRTITCSKTFGPTFGGTFFSQYDLQVFKSQKDVDTKLEQKRNFVLIDGQINFNSVYRNSGFSKQPNGGKLVVKDVEVYQVEELEKYTLYDEQRESVLESIQLHLMELFHKEVSFKSLYSTSEHGCSASRFHNLCDHKGSTLTVLYGKRSIYGGFATESWSSNNTQLIQSSTFLFCNSADRGITFTPLSKGTLICNTDYGPTFGNDLKAFMRNIETPKNGYFKSNGYAKFKNEDGPSDKIDMDMVVRNIEVIQVQVKEDKMWRDIDLKVKKELIVKTIMDKLCPDIYGAAMYNIILLGNIGAGKSSFCNTLTTAFKNKMVRPAVSASSAKSVTAKYRGYKFGVGTKTLPIRVFDTRGFDEEWKYSTGIELMLNGQIEDGFDFETNEQEECGARSAKSSARIHVVALVVDATKVDLLDKSMLQEINEIRQTIYKQELKLIVVATRFDEFDPFLKKFPDQIFSSSSARRHVDMIGSAIGVTTDMVIPFINYTNETSPNEVIDKIALYALDVLVKEANYYRRIVRNPMGSECSTKTDVRMKLEAKIGTNHGVKTLRILCVGKTFSGKSTFIDSIKSVLERKRSTTATVGFVADEGESDKPDTRKVKRYQLKIMDSRNASVGTNACIVDMPGFTEHGSINLEKIKWTIKGHVKNQTELVDTFSETSDLFVKCPQLKDQIHVVCIILDNESASDEVPKWEKDMFKSLFKWIKQEGIPIVTVLTKMDKIGPDLDEAKSKVVCNFGVSGSFIFPVHNYVHEQILDEERDTAFRDALNCMLEKGQEYLEDYEEEGD